jgi:hypothetical protein
MSGGSYDYAYIRIEELAHQIKTDPFCEEYSKSTPELRKAFKKHLLKVAKALKAIEWNDSGDGDDKEVELIRACLNKNAETNQCKIEFKEAVEKLERLLPKCVV